LGQTIIVAIFPPLVGPYQTSEQRRQVQPEFWVFWPQPGQGWLIGTPAGFGPSVQTLVPQVVLRQV